MNARSIVVIGRSLAANCRRFAHSGMTDVEALERARNAVSFSHRDLQIIRARPEQLAQKPPAGDPLKFGQHFSDYMGEIEWTAAGGWGKPVICPIHKLQLHPAAKVLHYAIEIFEGMKAYRGIDGKVRLFRPEKNMERMRRSAKRSTLPDFSPDELIEVVKELVRLEKDWIPNDTGYALYIRPALIGTDEQLGVAMSHKAKLFILAGPSGPYFNSKVSLLADPDFARSFPGGVGAYKMGCNYAPSIMLGTIALSKGCHQALWLYGPDEQITEVGATNIFFAWKNDSGEDELVTPPLHTGLILPGITRDSLLEIAREWNDFKVSERFVGMRDFRRALKENRVYEMFCAGTACVVSPVDKIIYKNKILGDYEELRIPSDPHRSVLQRLYKAITDIQYGRAERPGWTQLVC